MKRRRRGLPIPDPIPASEALALTNSLVGLGETLRQTSAALVQARASRDKYKARARHLEGVVDAARRHSETVAAEQAAKTAALRGDVVTVRRELTDISAARESESQRATAERETVAAAKAADEFRQRLAEGNAAYAQRLKEIQELRAELKEAAVANAQRQDDWDQLCRWFYQSSKGRPVTDNERQILTRWVTWRKEQHQQKQAKQARKKAEKK